MPDPVTHYVFGRHVLGDLPDNVRTNVDISIFDRAVQGPDPWSTMGFYGGKNKQYAIRSKIMHTSLTGSFLSVMAQQIYENKSASLFSVLAGNICHYCLDKSAHPYIICKGGEYGGHVRLERAIDCYYIRQHFGKTPWYFSIPKHIMKLKEYPRELRKPLNYIYSYVYGWNDAFELINRSLKSERLFYRLMQDPIGIVHILLRPISNGKTNYCMYSYYHRDAYNSSVDYMNVSHNPWHHPLDSTISSTDSFFDLFEKAQTEARNMIDNAYNMIFNSQIACFDELFGNDNYSSGFDCNDPRNNTTPQYMPIDFGGKYFNR